MHTGFIFATQKQYWWDANTETMRQQLLQLVSIIQECWIIEEKWRFVKSIRHLKRTDKKVRWRCASHKKSIQIVSKQGIKGPDTMGNLVWANTYISEFVMHDSVGIIIRSRYSPFAAAGAWCALPPPNKAPSPPNWNMKHYKLVEFLSNLNVKTPCTNVNHSVDDFLATVLSR